MAGMVAQNAPDYSDKRRVTGTVKYVGKGTKSYFAYVTGDDGTEYSITESIYSSIKPASGALKKGDRISFAPEKGNKKWLAADVKMEIRK